MTSRSLAFARKYGWRFARSLAFGALGELARVPGREFARFGRGLGWQAMRAGLPFGAEWLLYPVSSTRYWEFPFTWAHLPAGRSLGRCLDVSSPRLFSLFVAGRRAPASLRILNPDVRDAEQTRQAALLQGSAIAVDTSPVSIIDDERSKYDVIWSISVIEHIPDDGDTRAMATLYRALAPGGRLLLTVPVDRHAYDEYRPTDTYRLGMPATDRGYFFQRWYDEAGVRARLLEPIAPDRVTLRWYGEKRAGHFAAYIREWLARGRERTLADPIEFGRNYRTFDSWAAMPGAGVCGIAIDRAP